MKIGYMSYYMGMPFQFNLVCSYIGKIGVMSQVRLINKDRLYVGFDKKNIICIWTIKYKK